jgi:putative restriction endonuclease
LVSEQSLENLEGSLAANLKREYKSVERSQSTTNRLKRNPKISERIKQLYNFRCQVCNVLLEAPSGPIAIGAHIKPLGRPHSGPDVKENLLCLCPNHHDQFDALAFSIEPSTQKIVGLKDFEGKSLIVDKRHMLGEEFLRQHWERWTREQTA